ncbi:MAG: hypothetical protein ACKVZ0_04175 [Gemmatimonadales bacterium]
MSRVTLPVLAPHRRWSIGLVLSGVLLLTSGFSSCAGTTGPLTKPAFEITPDLVLLRASLAANADAISLARIDGGTRRGRYEATVEYLTRDGSGWLTVEMAGSDLTLRAAPGGLAPGIFLAKVTIADPREGSSASLRVEFQVTP